MYSENSLCKLLSTTQLHFDRGSQVHILCSLFSGDLLSDAHSSSHAHSGCLVPSPIIFRVVQAVHDYYCRFFTGPPICTPHKAQNDIMPSRVKGGLPTLYGNHLFFIVRVIREKVKDESMSRGISWWGKGHGIVSCSCMLVVRLGCLAQKKDIASQLVQLMASIYMAGPKRNEANDGDRLSMGFSISFN